MKDFKALTSRLARLLTVAALLVAFTTTAYAQDTTQAPPQEEMRDAAAQEGLVSTLEARGNFSTLVDALKKSGLAEQLQKSNQAFTLFAPTDEAFSALPPGTVDSLSAEQLSGLLRYHLVPGAVASSDALQQGQVASVQGANLTLAEGSSGATVNGATIVEPDVQAGSSVIHVIDSVLRPEQGGSMSGDAGTPETPDDASAGAKEGSGGSR